MVTYTLEYRLLTEGRRVYSVCDNMLGADEMRDILATNPNMSERRLDSIARQVAKSIETLRMLSHESS